MHRVKESLMCGSFLMPTWTPWLLKLTIFCTMIASTGMLFTSDHLFTISQGKILPVITCKCALLCNAEIFGSILPCKKVISTQVVSLFISLIVRLLLTSSLTLFHAASDTTYSTRGGIYAPL